MKKSIFKRSMSVFLACLMLMSCWVFVEPQYAHAANSVAEIAAANMAAINSITGSITIGNTVYGSFQNEDSYLEDSYKSQVYKNVLYSPKCASETVATSEQTLYSGTFWKNFATAAWFNAETTLMYDGITTPQTGIMMRITGRYSGIGGNNKVRLLSGYVASGGNGLDFNTTWHGADGNPNFNYAYWAYTGNSDYSNICAWYTYDGNAAGGYAFTKEKTVYYANVLKFTGDQSNFGSEYYIRTTPTFGFYASNASGDKFARATATTTNPIYVINVVPWNTAVAEALAIYNEINENPGKYSAASVAKFVELANALLAANPNEYITSSSNNVTGWNTAAKAAVDAWNAWHANDKIGGLVPIYTVTWKNYDGSVLETDECVEVNSTPTYNGSTPTKPATKEYSYTFSSWSPAVSAITGNTTYIAQFSQTGNKYNVVFDNLFDFSKFTIGTGSLTINERTDTGFTVTSTTGTDANTGFSYAIPVTPGKTYVFSADVSIEQADGDTRGFDMYINTLDANMAGEKTATVDTSNGAHKEGDVYISRTGQKGQQSGATDSYIRFTAGATTAYIKVRFDANTQGNKLTVNNIRVYEEGTIDADAPYVPSVSVTYDGTYSNLPTPTRDGYEFLGWYKADGTKLNSTDKVNITDTLYVTSKWKQLGHTVTWKNWDGSVIKSEIVEIGKIPTAPANPTRPATDEYTYTFTGWDKQIVAVTGDAEYTAQYSQTKNKYNVTWKVDGQPDVVTSVEYGKVPAYPNGTPTKAADAEFTYTFTGWDTTPVAVTKDVTYTAQFGTTTNTYTVEWVVNGQVVETDTVEYGKIPTYDGAEPTKAPNAQYSYTFDKWSPEIVAVTGHARYEATFTATLNKYTVNWVVDNEIYHTEQVEYGKTPTLPAPPTKAADAQYTYTFKEWTPTVTAVMNDTDYTAVFDKTVNKYTVTWYDEDGITELYSAEFEYGSTPVYGAEEPTKAATAQYKYTFAGWDRAYETVKADATYTATYSSTVNKYTIKFVNEDGTELQSSEVEYGTKPEYTGAEPTKDRTAQYTYVFTGWDPEIAAVTGDATYTAQFEATTNVYTVTWVNYDGTELEVDENVPYGTTPEYNGATPTKPQTDKYEYTFADEWSPEVDKVTGDVTYTAQFTGTVRKYTITWVVNGVPVKTDEVEYDTVPEYTGETPTKAADAQYTYTFKDWSPAVVAVTGPKTYVAEFDATVNTYTVTWVNDDGTELEKDENVPYGAMPSYDSATPTKAKDAQYTYTFDKWSPEISTVEGNITYKATYTTTTNKYTVTWKNEDGTVLETDVGVEYGATPSFDKDDPTKARTDEFTYTFAGWDPVVSDVTGDATYTATYTAEKNKYTITWKNDDGSVIDTTTVEYGEMPTHADPTKTATAQYTYTFAGWDPEVVKVTGPATYTATFTETTNTYTVTWVDEDGTVLETDDDVPYGATPSYDSATPTKAATAEFTYAFAGWDPTVSTVTGDATYTATYSSTVNSYEVKWVIDGNTVRTDIVEYGKTPAYGEDPIKAADAQYTYTFAGWDPEVKSVTGPATYTAEFDKTVNEYTVTWKNFDGTVLATDTVKYGTIPQYNGAIPEKDETAEFTYEHSGWTPEVVSVVGDAEYTATFESVTKSYKVEWIVDGNVWDEEYVLVGATIPTKEVPAKEGFIGAWDKNVTIMPAEPVTITAEYINNGITVTWIIDANTTYTTVVKEGSKIAPDENWKQKESTVDTVYTFLHWSEESNNGTDAGEFPTVAAGDADRKYYAVFAESVRKYTITFVDEKGTELQTGEVEYSETPAYTGTTPAKDRTAQYTYTFAGWTPEVVKVTGDATYTAQFDSTVNKYTVTWIVDGQPVKTEDVEYGTTPTFGADPTKEATAQHTYTFAGWTPAVSAVTDTAIYTANFNATVNKYTVKWVDENGTILETDTGVEYGTKPSFDGKTPTKSATAQYTYTFAGWDGLTNETTVTGDVTFIATYSSTVNEYTVTWVDENGTVLETDTGVEYGTKPSFDGKTPTKSATAQYTYTFAGWDGWTSETTVTGNATYTATYTATVNEYTITWENADGTEIKSESVEYGKKPEYTGETPVKEGDAQYSYVFTGWTPAIADVTKDATYTADFAQVVNEYTVTWVVEGEIVETDENVPYGTTPTFNGTTPTKKATAQYTYTFAGWEPDVSAITGDTIYNAKFDSTVNKYTVTWANDDGSEIYSEEIEYGATPEYTGEEPTKAATAQYTYAFDGWDKEITAVEGNVTYTATYSSTVNKYTVSWVVEGETVETDENVEYGTMASYDGAEPTKAGNAQYSYKFDKWTPEVSKVTGDVTYTATFTQSVNKYTVTWIVDGKETTEQVEYGTVPVFTGSTDKAPDNTTVYTFIDWDKEVVAVTGDATYTATYSEAVRLYTITWIVDGKTTTEQYKYNEVPSFKGSTDKPSTEGASYTFIGWNKELANVTDDAIYIAEYDVTVRMFTITWIVGDREIKQQWAYGTVPVFEGSTDKAPTATTTYAFAGWNETPVEVKSDATYTATYTESVRKYTVVWYVDGEFFATQDVAYNTVIPSLGLPAEKEGYTVRWDNSVTVMPTNDVEIHAIYTPRMYPVYWMVDGLTVYSESVPFGGKIPSKVVPAKAGHTGKWSEAPATMPAGIVTIEAIYTPNTYSVNWRIEGEQGSDKVTYGTDYVLTLDVEPLPEELRITVGGVAIGTELYYYDSVAGVLTIYGSAITGNINIVAKSTSGSVNVVINIFGGSSSNKSEVITTRQTYHTTINPSAGYLRPKNISVYIDGILLTDGYTYDADTGRLTVNAEIVVGELEIYAECPVDPNYNPSDDNISSDKCSCNCHTKNAFIKFFFDIATFFRRIFGMTQYRYCECGNAHW